MAKIIHGEISVSRNLRTVDAKVGRKMANTDSMTSGIAPEIENNQITAIVTPQNATYSRRVVIPENCKYLENSPHQS